jgi:hypothetical protein
MTEAQLKQKCSKQLEAWGWLVVHIIQCSKNGWPDTQILRNSKTLFIEFKVPGKQPRELQAYRIRKLREQGFETIIVHRIEDIFHLE